MYTKLLWKYCTEYRLPRAVSQPTIESIEVYESDKLELRDDWLIDISKKEQLFILRNVLVRIDGKYREGHGVLHMVYFPHESERARIANAALKGNGDTERNSTDEELEEEQRSRRLFGQRMWPRFTQEDLYQSMKEVSFETGTVKEMEPGEISDVARPIVSESGDADISDNDADSIASTQPESSMMVGGIRGDTSADTITEEDPPVLMPIAQEDDYVVLQQMFGLVDAPLVIANTPGRMPQFNLGILAMGIRDGRVSESAYLQELGVKEEGKKDGLTQTVDVELRLEGGVICEDEKGWGKAKGSTQRTWQQRVAKIEESQALQIQKLSEWKHHRLSGPSKSWSDTRVALRIQELGREAQKLDHEADMGSAD
ncbi:hypothetical protein C8Q73DRAFT_669900 [Cubamyces lactineus]|nr:hypothetical protein C8Q73DRAFT_669900 [Cubamyces lactineus]